MSHAIADLTSMLILVVLIVLEGMFFASFFCLVDGNCYMLIAENVDVQPLCGTLTCQAYEPISMGRDGKSDAFAGREGTVTRRRQQAVVRIFPTIGLPQYIGK